MNAFTFDPAARGYSRENAWWLGRFAELAYATPDAICQAVNPLGLTTFRFFDGPRTDTQAFLAANRNVILVVFRGTQPRKLLDWMTDLHADVVEGVHRGFRSALDEVWPDLSAAIDSAKGPRGSLLDLARLESASAVVPGLWITGHSLGGALAVLATQRMLEAQHPVEGLYTFGQPRVGTREWAHTLDAAFGPRYVRFVNNADVVPRVPLRTMGYAHAGTLRYFDANGDMHDDIGWWERLLDRFQGRVEDLGKLGPEDIKDHAMDNYWECLAKQRETSRQTGARHRETEDGKA